jgi:hypothetical protein
MGSKFFETEAGQKVLLFLAPFFLSPHEFENSTSNNSPFKKHLHLSAFAPLLGAAFLTGAVVSVFRTLNAKGISIAWILDYKSAYLIFWLAGILTWLGYSAALSRSGIGYLMKYIRPTITSTFRWPLAFWLSYYGGILIVWGVFSWILVGVLNLHFSYVTGGIALVFLILYGFYLRLEIKLAQEKNRRRIHYIDWGTYNTLSLTLFLVLQGLAGLLLFYLALPAPSVSP